MLLQRKATEKLDSILEAMRKATAEIPTEITTAAKRVLKFCREELPEDGALFKFPLGRVHYTAGHRTVLTITYQLEYSVKWESCYHNDSMRYETAVIRETPHFDSGFYEHTTKVAE